MELVLEGGVKRVADSRLLVPMQAPDFAAGVCLRVCVLDTTTRMEVEQGGEFDIEDDVDGRPSPLVGVRVSWRLMLEERKFSRSDCDLGAILEGCRKRQRPCFDYGRN